VTKLGLGVAPDDIQVVSQGQVMRLLGLRAEPLDRVSEHGLVQGDRALARVQPGPVELTGRVLRVAGYPLFRFVALHSDADFIPPRAEFLCASLFIVIDSRDE